MFQIPDWEENVPATNINFNQNSNKNKKKQVINNKNNSHQNGVSSSSQNDKKIQQNDLPKIKKKMKKSLIQFSTNETSDVGKFVKLNTFKTFDKPEKRNIINNHSKSSKKHQANGIIKPEQVQKNECKNDKKQGSSKRTFEAEKSETEVDLNESFEPNFDTDKLDEVILNAKKRKLNKFNNDEEKDVEEMFAQNSKPLSKKKEALKKMLQKASHRNEIKVSGNGLRERMLQRLKAAQFRYINERLYTSSGSDAKKLFQEDPSAFHTYHAGYQQQVKKWPVNPLDVVVKRISKMPKSHLIADMGCGEAVLSSRVPQKVRSFDLVAFNSNVEACDIAHTPLLASSIDVAVYCLALMGTDLTQYLVEANRVLKTGGHLLIAEVESRFDNVDTFITEVQKIGFSLKDLDKSNQVFYFMEFTKVRDPPKKSKLPHLTLKPCLYKKR